MSSLFYIPYSLLSGSLPWMSITLWPSNDMFFLNHYTVSVCCRIMSWRRLPGDSLSSWPRRVLSVSLHVNLNINYISRGKVLTWGIRMSHCLVSGAWQCSWHYLTQLHSGGERWMFPLRETFPLPLGLFIQVGVAQGVPVSTAKGDK